MAFIKDPNTLIFILPLNIYVSEVLVRMCQYLSPSYISYGHWPKINKDDHLLGRGWAVCKEKWKCYPSESSVCHVLFYEWTQLCQTAYTNL